MTEPIIYRNGCWDCKRALEDPAEKYRCPYAQQHFTAWKNHDESN